MDPNNTITIKASNDVKQGVDEYLDYKRIVGDDDHGNLFTPQEYEAYKKKYIPMRIKNRIYMSWVNPNGIDCVLSGPQTQCFCEHRYIEHKTDFEIIPKERPILQPCTKCRCKNYHLLPKMGNPTCRCHCKHEACDHVVEEPYICKKVGCKCTGFITSITCECGFPANRHRDLAEIAVEREARGHPLGQPCPYKAMGGLTGFSSLLGGMERMDPSGGAYGAIAEEELSAPIGPNDHPFLRENKATVEAYERQKVPIHRFNEIKNHGSGHKQSKSNK